MADKSFFVALASAPSALVPRVVPADSRKIAPNFQSAFAYEYFQVFTAWKEKNALVAKVAAGRASFASELRAVVDGHVSEGTERFVLLESCLGPLDSVIHPLSSPVKLGVAGSGFGGCSGLLFGRAQLGRDPDFRFDPALSTQYGRRAFLMFMGVAGAFVFGLVGCGVGYWLSSSARRSLPERASALDSVVSWLRSYAM